MSELKPIPTKFNGIEFRSRLEARWAIVFTELGIEFLYENEGYQLDCGWYVPDFYLPQMKEGTFIEIKPTYPTSIEEAKLTELANRSQRRSIFLYGPLLDYDGLIVGPECWDKDYKLCGCVVCAEMGIEFEGRGGRVCKQRHGKWDDRYTNNDDPLFVHAIKKATTHRFW